MIIFRRLIPSNTELYASLLRHHTNQTVIGLLLICGLMAPPSLLANTLNTQQDVTFREIKASPYDTDPGAAPEPQRLGNPQLQTLAEEASKQAQTKYLAKKFRQKPKAVRHYVDLAWAESERRNGIAPELLIAIMQKESSLRPHVRSRYGAQGLMQVVRRWHREKLSPSESLLDPEVNIRVGADILEEYLELAGGNLAKALKKYSGNARGYSSRILKESRKLSDIASQAVALG